MNFHMVIFKPISMYECTSKMWEEENKWKIFITNIFSFVNMKSFFLLILKSTCVMLRVYWELVDDKDKGKVFMHRKIFSSHSYNIGKLAFRDRRRSMIVWRFFLFFAFFTQFFVYILIEKYFRRFTFTFRF